jgi:hypothetical protein
MSGGLGSAGLSIVDPKGTDEDELGLKSLSYEELVKLSGEPEKWKAKTRRERMAEEAAEK